MKRKGFLIVLITILISFITSICIAVPGKSKGTANTNKQSLETSTRGKERAEERHQMKEENEPGKKAEGYAADGDDEKKKKKKDKKAQKKVKGDKDKGDDGSDKNNDSSADKVDASSGEELKAKKGRWWDFFKNSEE